MRWRLLNLTHVPRLAARLVPRRRWQRVLVAVLLVFVVAWFVVPQLFVPMIRGKLQGMIGGHLDARLEIGRLMYAPPFGVRARQVRLVSKTSLPGWKGDVELLRVAKLDLKLARLPFRKGPLVIQNVTVTDPEVHLIRTEDGRLVGMHDFVRPDSPTARAATQPRPRPDTRPAGAGEPPTTRPAFDVDVDDEREAEREAATAKLSDMFELRHFGIHGGRVVYEDRGRPDLPPVVWQDLNVGMETTPREKGVYGYELEASNRDLARLTSSGSFDLDALLAEVGSFRVEVRTAYTEEQSPLPAQVQRALRDYRVQGQVTLDAGGIFHLRDESDSTYYATIELKDASGYYPEWDATLDRLSLKVSLDNRQSVPVTDATDGRDATSVPGATSRSKPSAGPVRLWVEGLSAVSGGSTFTLDKAEAVLDRQAGTWALAEVAGRVELAGDAASLPKQSRPVLAGMGARGRVDFTVAANGHLAPGPGQYLLAPEDLAVLVYPRGVTFRPRKFPAALENIGGGGSVRKDRGSRVVVFQNLTFSYGGDPIELASARLPLPADLSRLREQTRLEEISGAIDFRRPGPRYPGGFGKVVAALRPVGAFVIGRDSWYSVSAVEPDDLRIRSDMASPPRLPPPRKSDYFFSVSTDAGSFTLTDYRLPLLNLRGDATVSNMLIDVRRLEADVLGGRLRGAMKVTPGPVLKYQGKAYVRGLDLSALSRLLILPESPQSRLSGVGNLDAEFAGGKARGPEESLLSAVRAAGEFEVLRGDFWTIPVLGDVAGQVNKRHSKQKESLGTIGEAAGLFELADGTLRLRDAAVSSPALGVLGSGTIGLGDEKRLDLHIVAAPLGDWKDKMRQTNVPLLSDVAGEIVGAVQQVLKTATSTLLYEFRVTGTVKEPDVATVPVPALTEPAALLFGRMVRGGEKDQRLLESVKGGRTHEPPREGDGTPPAPRTGGRER